MTQTEQSNTMHNLLKKAKSTIDDMASNSRTATFMEECSGVLVMSATEYALALSGQHGTGVLVKHFKDTNKWSNPSATRLRGLGVGIQMGKASKNIVMFLSDHEVRTLTDTAILRFGVQSSFYIASVEAETYVMVSDIFNMGGRCDSNKISGTKTGISFQSAAISPMWNANRDFYGDLWHPNVVKPVPKKIFEGKTKKEFSVEDKELVNALHNSLNNVMRNEMDTSRENLIDLKATAAVVA